MREQHTIRRLVALIMLIAAVCSGCSRTVVTREAFYPQSSDWQSAEYRVLVVSEGALGKSYIHQSRKRISVLLFKKGAVQSTNSLELIAGDLDCEINWPDLGN